MRSTNPVLSRRDVFTREGYATSPERAPQPAGGGIVYRKDDRHPPTPTPSRAMTLDDVVLRTGLLLVTAVVTGGVSWALDLPVGVAILAVFAGLGLAIVNSFKRVPSPPLIIAYAAVEGVFLGVISHLLEAEYPGIVGQAVAGTAVATGVMLVLYRTGRIRVTKRFTKVLLGATMAYFILMFGNFVLRLIFGGDSGFNPWSGGFGLVTAGIGIVLACLFLVLDFDMIEQSINAGVPEQESWRAAFALTVTLVWLYFEMLRLLAILRGE